MKAAVVYWSMSGNTEAMAEAVSEGIKEAGGEVDVITAGDFEASQINDYDSFVFGCPAMGSEELEEGEFEPMFESVEHELGDKKVVLFGSYGWGDGQWMRDWEARAQEDGINLVSEPLIVNDAPDDDAIAECKKLGASLI